MYIAREQEPLGNIFKKLVSNTIKFTQAVDPVSKILSKTNIAKTKVGAILVPTAINVSKPKTVTQQPSAVVETPAPIVEQPQPEAEKSFFDPTTKKVLVYGGIGVGVLALSYIVYRATKKKKPAAVSGVSGLNGKRKRRKKSTSKK